MTLAQLLRGGGYRTETNILNPLIIPIEEFSLPKNSIVLWSDGLPTSEDSFISRLKKPTVFIAERLTSKRVGNVKNSNIGINRILSNRNSMEGLPTHVRRVSELDNIPASKDIVIDYSELNTIYKYTRDKENPLHKLRNKLRTQLEDIKDSNYTVRMEYIHVNLPKAIPNFKTIEKALKYDNYRMLPLIDESFFIHFEIIKYLLEDYREKSIFSTIEDYQYSTPYILLQSPNGVSIIELNKLFAMSNETGIEINRFNKVSPKILIKRYLLGLTTLSPAKEVVGNKPEDKKEVITAKTDEEVEETLDKEVEIYNVDNEEIPLHEEVDIEEVEVNDIEPATDTLNAGLSLLETRGIVDKRKIEKMSEESSIALKKYEEALPSKEDTDVVRKKLPVGTLVDERMAYATIEDSKRQYREKVLLKHLDRSMLAISKTGFIVTDIETTKVADLSNRKDIKTVSIRQLNGTVIKLPLHIPTPDKNGEFLVNGSKFKMANQRVDAPIKKTKPTEVVLSSYFGKMFIRRAERASSDVSIKIFKMLSKMAASVDSDINIIVPGNNKAYDVELPTEYTMIGRATASFMKKDTLFQFSYQDRSTLLIGKDTLKDIEPKGTILVGSSDKHYYVVDKDNQITKLDRSGTIIETHPSLLEYFGLYSLDYEFAVTKIRGTVVPIALILIYYMGMTKLLKKLRIKYSLTEKPDKDVDSFISLRFNDGYLVLDRSNAFSSLIIGSLSMYKNEIKEVSFKLLNNRDTIKDLLAMRGVDLNILFALDAIRTLFIDPMTEEVLLRMGKPTSMPALIINAVELLKDDNLTDPRDLKTFLIKGEERLAGMVYHTLSKAVALHLSKVGRVRSKVTVEPYTVYRNLTSDATFNLKEDLNPIEELKQTEEVTLLGMFGREKDTITSKDREFHPSLVGTLSEATKDNVNVGTTGYYSATPNIDNTYGIASSTGRDGSSDLYSTSVALAPAATTDDGKRALYISIQSKHLVATNEGIVIPYRTGMESVMPYRANPNSALHATEAGKVIEKNKKKITIKYKDSKESYELKDWISKDKAGKAYKHSIRTLLKVGDKVVEGDNIYYDYLYYGEDVFNRKRVCYKSGVLALAVQTEGEDDFEDASNLTNGFIKKMEVDITYTKDKTIDLSTTIEELKRIGDKVTFNDNLILYRATGEGNSKALSEESMKVLNAISASKFKAEAKGTIVDIEIYYNIPEDEDSDIVVSDSMKELIKEFDKLMVKKKGLTGAVDSTFSVKGRGLQPGTIYIKYYIEKTLGMAPGDKFRIASQLKSTVAVIYSSIVTESGRQVDIETGKRGIDARIVDSPYRQGEINLVLDQIEKNFLSDLG